MRYYEPAKHKKIVGSTGFYSVIAVCLIALGAVSWFAVSRYNSLNEKPQSESSSQNNFSSSESLVSDSVPEETGDETQDNSIVTDNSKTDVPYEEDNEFEKEPKAEAKQSFIAPLSGNISKDFSDTVLQYSKTYGDMRLHGGADILAKSGTDIKSVGNGTVTSIEESADFGKCVTVDCGNEITVKYCGFDTVAVSKSEKVTTGRVLGKLGQIPSECADESHLHLEITKQGKRVSPLEILGLE